MRKETLDALEQELERCARELSKMGDANQNWDEAFRLYGKADGVRLALGKLQQARREAKDPEFCDCGPEGLGPHGQDPDCAANK